MPPVFRVCNPITQGRKLDPDGADIRTWVPEPRDAPDPHEPVDPIVDHAEERREARDRYERIRR
jgi:deoxyribodipyrimidine photo-lyase